MKELIKILKTFYQFETKKKGWFGAFMAINITAAVVSGVYPYFYKIFIDEIPNLNYERLLTILISFVVIRYAGLLLSSFSHHVGDVVLLPATVDARVKILKHIQNLDFAFHANKSTGSLISAMKRGDGAFFALHHAINFRILRVIIGFFVMMYFFSSLDLRIAGLVLLALLVNLLITKFIVGYNIKTRKDFNKKEDNISAVILDNIINFETVKLFAKESWEISRLRKTFVPWLKSFWRYIWSFRILDLSVGTLVELSIFVILLFTLKLSVNKELSVGDFALILGFVNSFFPRFFDLVWGFRDIAKNYADIQKYFGILDYDIEVKDPEKPVIIDGVRGEIEYKKVSFTYDDEFDNAIKNINLHIRQDQSVALIGRSGSGKTTLVKLLLRFYDVQKGAITIDGVDIKDLNKSTLRSFIGVVPQEPIMFNNTIEFNIGYGSASSNKKELIAAAKIANLHKFVESLPRKYKTNVGERGIKLSGGQKQRLAIARMILSDPEIVIFDEATSQLDSENEKMIQDAFWKATKNKTTIIIAHRLSTAMRADKIIVLEGGKIVEEGSHKSLLNNKDSLYKYLWDLQTAQI